MFVNTKWADLDERRVECERLVEVFDGRVKALAHQMNGGTLEEIQLALWFGRNQLRVEIESLRVLAAAKRLVASSAQLRRCCQTGNIKWLQTTHK